ncbi:hypothetical protein GJS40_03625 [Aliibacillus thermotolerans]|nr:hypothetical protein [Aliibacillus thermotolerans]
MKGGEDSLKKIVNYMKNERGSQLIEFVAVFPLIIFAFLFVWQMALVAYTVVVAEGAARDGARVAAVEGDGGAVYSRVESSAGGLDVLNVNTTRSSGAYGDEVQVEVTVALKTIDVPFIGEFDYDITREATMPYESSENE